MRRRSTFLALTIAFSVVSTARSGHELPVYPSYYPHEIELATVAPDRAAELLLAGKIQAYVGGAPRFATPPPGSIDSVASLGSYVIVRINPNSPFGGDARSACATGDAVIRDIASKSGDLLVHPYPITPFLGDYLHHIDLAEATRARILGGRADPSAPDPRNLRVKAADGIAQSLVRPEWRAQGPDWDVEIAEIKAAEIVASARHSTNGWLGPAWLRTGWFHASLVVGTPDDELLKDRIEAELRRLQTVDYADAVERINLERSLVATLAGGCRVRVAGYTVKREFFSTVFTAGIENVAYDSVTGLNSPMFMRTVKLKDFPWNGWLALAIDATPTAAWNPVAGFTDHFGQLMWSAIGDPAAIPSPNESAWVLNRISDVQSSKGP
jgi:hypothetical protein